MPILVVFEHLIDVNRTFPVRLESVGESLATNLGIHEDTDHLVSERRTHIKLRVGKQKGLSRRCSNLKCLASISIGDF